MSENSSGLPILEIILNASHVREARYQDEAARLRALAGVERNSKLRDALLQLAEKYDALASSVSRPPD
ncbi:MAG TPA: hypothetical protein VG308_14420 [Stellaceae bacterium]|jgi:hypothetical protein|nr:hypothetical protein [Stellaceae bacterium]